MPSTHDLFVHRYVPGAPSAPALLLLHGTGGTEDSLIDLGRELMPEAHLISPRGKVLENGMPRFFKRLAEGVFDMDDLLLQTANLNDFIAAARHEYLKEGTPLFAVGYSNGANIAANLLLTYGGVLQGAALLRTMLPGAPATPAPLTGIPILMMAGKLDQMIPRQSVMELHKLFVEAGAAATIHWEPGGHGLTSADIEITKAWLSAQRP